MKILIAKKYFDEEWQINEIRNALEEADRGEFAEDRVVAETFRKWAQKTSGSDR